MRTIGSTCSFWVTCKAKIRKISSNGKRANNLNSNLENMSRNPTAIKTKRVRILFKT